MAIIDRLDELQGENAGLVLAFVVGVIKQANLDKAEENRIISEFREAFFDGDYENVFIAGEEALLEAFGEGIYG